MRPILGGTILTDERVTRHWPFLFLLAFFALVLITNRNGAERTIRQIEVLQDTLAELRSESVELSAILMEASRPSEVVEKVKAAGMGLEEPARPPMKIRVEKQ